MTEPNLPPGLSARICLGLSAAIVFLLGAAHLFHTFHGKGLWPRDLRVQTVMDATPLGLTASTTVWRAWVGFNASHALGLILFAAVYGHLALQSSPAQTPSAFLLATGLAVLTLQMVLARLFWFEVPLAGLAVAWLLFAAALVLR